MNNIRFSIIICSYNVQNYIGRTIESILKQDFQDYEIIISDDCSTDLTLKNIEEYNDDRIVVISSCENFGPSVARNKAFQIAKGEYILYLDGDDTLYENTTLSKINDVIRNDQIDLIYFGVNYVGGLNKSYIPTEQNSTREARILCDMHFPVASKCWRREFLNENDIEFIQGIYYEDMVYSIKATIFAKTLRYGSFPIYNYYRNREGSIMSTPSIKRCIDMYKILEHLMELYEITPKEYKPYLLSFIKNETYSIPERIDNILNALENNSLCKISKKREYKLI